MTIPAQAPTRAGWRNSFGFLLILLGAVAVLFAPALLRGEHPAYRDGGHWYAPLWQWAQQCWGRGTIPLWDPLQNIGESHIADGTSSVFYPGKLIFALPVDFSLAYTLFLAGHLVLAGATMFRLCRSWGASWAASALGGISYALSGSVFYQIYNAPFLIGAAWLPLALSAVSEIVLCPRPRAAVRFAVAMALMLLGGDSQMAYHVLLILTPLLLVVCRPGRKSASGESPPGSSARSYQMAAAGLLLAVALSAVQLFPSSGRVADSERSEYEHPRTCWELASGSHELRDARGLLGQTIPGTHHHRVFQFSVGPWRWLELAYSNIFGNVAPQHSRWIHVLPAEGRVWTPSLYFGILPLLCVALSIRHISLLDRRFRWAFGILLFFALAAIGVYGVGWLIDEITRRIGLKSPLSDSVGWPFGGLYWLMTVALPGYVYFRYPAKLWVVAAAACSLLASAGWDQLRCQTTQARNGMLRYAIGSLILGMVAWLVAGSLLNPLDLADRVFGPLCTDMASRSILWACFRASLLGFALWWLIGRIRDRNPSTALTTILLLLATLDLVESQRSHVLTVRPEPLGSEFVQSDNLSDSKPPPRRFRTADMRRRPSDWLATTSPDRMRTVVNWDRRNLAPQHHHQQGIALINSRTSIDSKDWGTLMRLGMTNATQLEQFEFLSTLSVDDSPRAWFVDDVEYISATDGLSTAENNQRLRNIWFPNGRLRDFRNQAVVEEPSNAKLRRILPSSDFPGANRCEVVSYSPNQVELNVHVSAECLLVLNEAFDRGWRAEQWVGTSSPSQPVRILCVNAVMRGIQLQPGVTKIRMTYLPNSFLIGGALSGIGWLIVAGYWCRRIIRTFSV